MKKIKIKKDKNIIINSDKFEFLNPDAVFIPANNIDIKNVYKNDLIGNISVPISGKIKGVININNKDYLRIDNDFRELEKRKSSKYKEITIDIIKRVLKENNLDLYNKFNKSFNNIVINVINDDPYIYNKIYLLKDKTKEVLDIFNTLSVLYKSDNNYLVMKSNESYMINETLNLIGTYPNIKVTLIDDYYLMEKEEYLLEVLDLKNNTLYLDIEELMYIESLLNGSDTTTKLITISGDAIKTSIVIRVKKYTLLKEILNKYIKIIEKDYKIIVNGLLNGYEIQANNNLIITDDIKYINIMKNKKENIHECINCGKCIQICPKKVNPLTLKNKKKCIDCGLCSYICPCHINLRKVLKDE